jgi:hypothetical protein
LQPEALGCFECGRVLEFQDSSLGESEDLRAFGSAKAGALLGTKVGELESWKVRVWNFMSISIEELEGLRV